MIANAVIARTEIGIDDHGILTAFLKLDMGGRMGGFGGYELYSPATKDKNFAGHFIKRVFEIVGVNYWDALTHKAVRVVVDEEKKAIEAIGNIINDTWYYPKKEFDEMWGGK
jgi:hypothetical protein